METIELGELEKLGAEGDALIMGGRLWRGELRVGDVFTVLRLPGDDAVPIHATVGAIALYGHDVEQLDEGLTAAITFHGLPTHMPSGAVLSGIAQDPVDSDRG